MNTCCTVGMLMGDAWMCLPALVDLCRRGSVELIAGSYALPVWEWAAAHVVDADYKIVRVIDDPDVEGHPFRPMLGFPALNKALEFVKLEVTDALGYSDIGNAYNYGGQYPPLKLKDWEVKQGPAVVVQPLSTHAWKNCGRVITGLHFEKPVQVVGLPGEFRREGWEALEGFAAMVQAVLECAGFVGVLSSWTNLAALFQKPQVIVSYCSDVPISNPNARVLIRPSFLTLQNACTEMGL